MIDPIHEVLQRLRNQTAGERPPEALESRLLAAFRAHHAPVVSRPGRKLWPAIAWGAAACLAIALGWRIGADRPAVSPEPVAVAKGERKPPVKAPETGQVVEAAPARPAKLMAQPRNRRLAARQAPGAMTGAGPFFEIPYAPALEPYDSGQVVRVNMRGASVRRLGLAVMTDRVQADVLMGDDGIARAIRVISDSGLNSIR